MHSRSGRAAAWSLCLVSMAGPLNAQHAHDHMAASQSTAAPSATALHMTMTPLGAEHAGDSARVTQLTWAVRRGIAQYVDVKVALRDGYRPLFIGDTSTGQVLHYTHIWRGMQENRRLDPAQPGSLLYEKQADGALRLVGAMYSAPEHSTPEQLDARVPLAYARWHLHTDICVPRPIWDSKKWAEKLPDGQPAYGPDSPIATKGACDKLGGNFRPVTFGWMVHAMAIDGASPRDVWGGGSGHDMAGMTGTAPTARTPEQ